MYSQDPKARRRQVKLRYFTYGFMTVMSVALTVLGVFYVLGYRIDRSFEIQRGGLAKFDSRPQEAEVFVDGQAVNTTPYQMNLPIGQYDISYSREGYQGWQKTIDMRAGEVLWLNYARLIPQSITTTVSRELEQLAQTSTSQNREWYVIKEAANTPEFIVMDLSNERNPEETSVTLPRASYTQPKDEKTSRFEIVAWDRSSEYMLVRHRFDDTAEYIRMPVEDVVDSENLSKLFDMNLSRIEFSSSNPNIFFAVDEDDTLYRLDMNDEAQPVKIASDVSVFENLNDTRVAFVAPAAAPTVIAEDEREPLVERSLYIWDRSDNNTETLSAIADNVPVHLSYNPYLTQNYLAMVAENNITIVQDPTGSAKKVVLSDTLDFTPTSLSASPGNRFFVAQRKDKLFVYDVEIGKDTPVTAAKEVREPLQWADDHHLALLGGGNLRLTEFDGANTQFITSIVARHDVVIGREGEILLSIGRGASGKPVLQQSWLLTERDR